MATAKTTTFQVRGFHCSGCSETVGRVLGSVDGVIRVRARYDIGEVEVRFDPDRVSEDDLRDRISAAGFETE